MADSSFETPDIGLGNYSYNPGPAGYGWDYVGYSGIASNGSPFGNADAPDGTQAAILQMDGSMSQIIDFPAAGNFFVSFQSAQRPGNAQDFEVLVDGIVVGTFARRTARGRPTARPSSPRARAPTR